jgi:hypothetical protein
VACTATSAVGACRNGTTACTGGAVVCNASAPTTEVCDGIDNDCDSATDESGGVGSPTLSRVCYAGPGGTFTGACGNAPMSCNPVGVCRGVQQVCPGAGGFPSCTTTTVGADGGTQQFRTAETCNGLDDDCNGAVDNGSPGAGLACTATSAVGACRNGTTACTGGAVACNASAPTTEVCDGIDNDCDSATDESGGVGSPKLSRTCYAGPAGTFSGTCGAVPATTCSPTGACRGVPIFCSGLPDAGAAFPVCSMSTTAPDGGGQVFPQTEVCDLLDNDCDGQLNEGLFGASCTTGQPGECSAGVFSCNASGVSLCTPIKSPSAEVCNNLDDDCDGVVDDNVPARPCFDGPVGTFTGVCAASDGGLAGDGGICTGRGACRASTQSCNGAGAWLACGAGLPTNQQQVLPSPEVCDPVDNDCDGLINEGTEGLVCTTGRPGICSPGTTRCSPAGVPSCLGNQDAGAEVCNNLDDDCNGVTDDGIARRSCFDGPATAYTGQCGLSDGGVQGASGACSPRGACRSSTQACSAGLWGVCGVGLSSAEQPVLPMSEVCDGLDNDCNGAIDNGLFVDADNDMVRACSTCGANPDGGCDCDDGNPNVRPGRLELCNGLDDNCNGALDESSTGAGKISQNCYSGPPNTQGRGVCVAGTQECNSAPGSNMTSYGVCMGERVPTPELCNNQDDDCDGDIDDGFDVDNDGFRACVACGLSTNCDCDDSNASIRPGAVELCDMIDQNCNNRLDDVMPRTCFSDSMGNNPPPTTYAGACPGPTCQPRGVCRTGIQGCNTAGAWGACVGPTLPRTEMCDGTDDDCDGIVDNGNFDRDMDSFVSCALCITALDGGVCDCNDMDPAIKPGAPEICDNIDNDCDNRIDGNNTACYSGPARTRGKGICRDGAQMCLMGMGQGACGGEVLPTLLPDAGGPRFDPDGGINDPELLCDGRDEDCDGIVDDGFDQDGDGITTCQNDCDDTDGFNKPGGAEICDCRDNNCNSVIDDSNVCRGAPCFDFDGDGVTNCQGDCNDDPARGGRTVGPTRSELVGDNLDNDCDGQVDENTDEDGDGFSTGGPPGMRDCQDKIGDVNPGAVERCDGFDNNCDGRVDEGFDVDGDRVAVCAGDCNDMDPTVNPTRREVCGNLRDDNCDGRVDEDTDNDGDGVGTCAGDCNDYNASVHPASGPVSASPEVCDGQDNNCDGQFDEGFDEDSDGVPVCFGDCNDTNANIGPHTFEVPSNMVDDDCDGQVDEGQMDRDGDGFAPVCGDCNDFDPNINPHASERCNRVDDNCDSYVDALPARPALCSVCFDGDGDGQTNCDGDCNDNDRSVYRGAPEICDLKDNDCDQQVDIDPVSGRRVCMGGAGGGTAGGAAGGTAGGTAGGAAGADSGEMMGGTDAGLEGPQTPGIVEVGCGCGTSGAGVALFIAVVLVSGVRRRRTALTSPLDGGRAGGAVRGGDRT